MRKVPYPHPGEILLEEFLKPMGITQYRLAKEIGVLQRRIGEIVAGARYHRRYRPPSIAIFRHVRGFLDRFADGLRRSQDQGFPCQDAGEDQAMDSGRGSFGYPGLTKHWSRPRKPLHFAEARRAAAQLVVSLSVNDRLHRIGLFSGLGRPRHTGLPDRSAKPTGPLFLIPPFCPRSVDPSAGSE